jgi:hypothetical protein
MPKTGTRRFVLSTENAPECRCNQLETNQINPEEIVLLDTRKALTEKGVGSIVEKVPRGLRNSKSPET